MSFEQTKAPLTEHGFHDATIDPDQIQRWWAQHAGANIAMATEGLVVIDIDGDPWADRMPAPQALSDELIAEGHALPVARVQAMHEGKRRARTRGRD